jgi:hypothetical protein
MIGAIADDVIGSRFEGYGIKTTGLWEFGICIGLSKFVDICAL